MQSDTVSRLCAVALTVMSLSALLLLLVFGLAQPPQPAPHDEGTPARIFQLILVLLVPVGLLYIATANWRQPWRSVRPLAFAIVVAVLALAGVYYMENIR